MSQWSGRVTVSSSGLNTFSSIGFQPTWATFRVAGLAGGGDTIQHFSLGSTDGTRQNCGSTFGDGTGHASFDTNTKVISHYERSGGTVTEVLAAAFDSFTATGLKLNASTPNSNYQVTINCGN